MTTGTTTATRTTDPTAARNPHGAVEAAIVNLVPLWVANHLLEWEWPPFLTPEYSSRPSTTTCCRGSRSPSAPPSPPTCCGRCDPRWLRHLGEAALDAVTIVVAVRMWRVFPFDFTTDSRIWGVGDRALIVIAGAGAAIGLLVELGRFIGQAGRSIGGAARPRHA